MAQIIVAVVQSQRGEDHEPERVELPVNKTLGGQFQLVWQLPSLSFVSDVLHNPLYAGAYAYGRRPSEVVVKDGQSRKRQRSPQPAEAASVFIPDHHPGFVSWAQYQRNQDIMRRNGSNFMHDESALALDQVAASDHIPFFMDADPPDAQAAIQALDSRLFRPQGEERLVATHRSVAEYLGARWLAHRVDRKGLPVARVLGLILGDDGGVISGLKGLFAWLALHCRSARSRLLDADPLSVILYGDAAPLSATDKRRLLAGLGREAERYPGFRRDAGIGHTLGALADPELPSDFLDILASPRRDSAGWNPCFREGCNRTIPRGVGGMEPVFSTAAGMAGAPVVG